MEMLDDLTRVFNLCNCLWPIQKYRNGDGHNPSCPAHVPMGSKRPASDIAGTMCEQQKVDSPETTIVDYGVVLRWSCCGVSTVLQKSTPFRLYPELIRYVHKSAVETRDAPHA